MARRNLDWHVGWWSETLLTATQAQQIVLTLVTDAELMEREDDVIVERVVGQYYIFNQGETGLTTHVRLSVRPENEAAIFTLDQTLAINADEQFMWHKVQRVSALGDNMEKSHPEWSHIDCRVNRKLEGLDRLVMVFENFDPVASEFWFVGAWIRVLLKT